MMLRGGLLATPFSLFSIHARKWATETSMRKFILAAAAFGALAFAYVGVNPIISLAQSVAIYTDQGGAGFHIGSGGTQTVENGGTLNIANGGKLKIAGVDVTAGAGGSNVAGVAAGYKIARGETALGGSNPTAVTTGLATITGCSLTMKATAAPGVGTSVVTYCSSSGTMNMYGWKVTATGDATLIASTGTETIGWVCVGT